MLTSEEYQVFSQQVAAAERLADALNSANLPGPAADVMGLRQSLRQCMTRAIASGTALVEADAVLTAVLKGADQ